MSIRSKELSKNQNQNQNQNQILSECLTTHINLFKKLINKFLSDNDNNYNKLIKKIIIDSKYFNDITVKQEEDNTEAIDKYFINAIKVFDNDVSSSSEICIPLDLVNVFNFTYPLLIPDHAFYNMLDVNDEIFIYQTISQDSIMGFNYNNIHLSVLIKTKSGFVFSFGLIGGTGKEDIIKHGLFNFTNIQNAKIITPDKFLEYKLNYEITNQEQPSSFVKLIAKTQLKRSHIDKIKAIFTNIGDKYKIEMYLDYFDDSLIGETYRENIINLNKQLQYILNEKKDLIEKQSSKDIYKNTIGLFQEGIKLRKYYLYPCFSYDYPLNNYCTFSRYTGDAGRAERKEQSKKALNQQNTEKLKLTKKTVNCSSFLQDLFNDIITCTGSGIVSLSQYCHQKKDNIVKPC